MSSIPTTVHFPAPPQDVSSPPLTTYHLFFITGNPGLISYYTHFLHTLHSELNTSPTLRQRHANVAVYGRSLRGFEVEDESTSAVIEPFGLQEQIDFVEATLGEYVTSPQSPPLAATSTQQGRGGYHRVVLLGHSVGAYILLTLLSSHLNTFSPTHENKLPNTTITAGICLFPTVVDIAASPSGKRLGWLVRIPGLPGFVQGLVTSLRWVMGRSVFKWVVGVVTGMPEEAKRVTTAFLGTEGGVKQAIHMARDELFQITADKWDSRIWGSAATTGTTTPQLFFYFGRNDHWVAERTRDDLMKLRGRKAEVAERAGEEEDKQSWRPRMDVDECGVPHGFCVRDEHSTIVALKCRDYIEEVVLKGLKE